MNDIPKRTLGRTGFEVTTLGFGEIVRITFNNLDDWTGGPNGLLGIERPKLCWPSFAGGFHWESWSFSVNSTPYYYLVLVLIGLSRMCWLLSGYCWSSQSRAC